jgi:pyruvate kinase
VADGIVAAAREIAETTEHQGDLLLQPVGHHGRLVARERPRVPILALTPLMSPRGGWR